MISPGTAAYEVVLSGDLALRLPADFDPDKVSQRWLRRAQHANADRFRCLPDQRD